ncbi:MAG: hypothetical protein HY235_02335 [Acidobacteria bacterium]|nr:hypothetical protein [Acidobacteriota bacterium]
MAAIRVFLAFVFFLTASLAQTRSYPMDSLDGLKLHRVKAEPVTYKSKKGIRVTEAASDRSEDRLVIVSGAELQDGVIEAEISGAPGEGAAEAARGFVGVAFRLAPDASRFECFYLRPTNGRAGDQVRRNHSAQYISFPDFPWQKLRKESPENYESYTDLVPGEWTRVKVEVRGLEARLFVHGAGQPTLIVSDLKLGETKGGVAFWIGPGTVAHLTNLRISR